MKVSDEVLAALGAATTDGNQLHLKGQLDRNVYTATAKVIEAAGGKWNKAKGCHIFEGDAAEAIDPILATGQVTSRKVELQAFFTPPELADRVVAAARIQAGAVALEPSAGEGAIAKAAKSAGASVICVDIDHQHVATLTGQGFDAFQADFLQFPTGAIQPVDVVLMNPPFTGGQDVEHVMHALGFVKPGGRLVAITSPGWTFKSDKRSKAFRETLERLSATWEELPEGSFKASGTNVRTLLLTIQL